MTIAVVTVHDPELPGLSFFTARFAHSMWTSAKSLQKKTEGSKVACDVVFPWCCPAGPRLNTPILQLGARFAVDLR